MKKDQLPKLVGHAVRLQPPAQGQDGRPVDDDWRVTSVTDEALSLENARTKSNALIGLDGVYSYFSDPARSTATEKHGFLQLLVAVRIADGGAVAVSPLPPPRTTGDAFPAERFQPFVLSHNGEERYFSWRGRDPVHLCSDEHAKQASDIALPLTLALRIETGREPRFEHAAYISGDPVFELSSDYRARQRLLGGAIVGGDMVLVLTNTPARFSNGDELVRHAQPCSCGRGSAKFEYPRAELVQLIAKDKLRMYCIMCDGHFELSAEEKAKLKQRLVDGRR